MPVVDVKNLDGKTVGKVELSDEVFAARVNPHVLHETVRHYLAKQRAGTHKTKQKSEVSGSGRKLWRQKGTGRARIGSIRSPLWRKGGTVHGPVPRSYDYRIPRQVVAGALRSALSAKLAESKLTVVDAWRLESHKTKPFRQALTKLDDASRTILLVENGANVNLERASRNLEGVKLVPTTALEAYDLLRHDRLMLSRQAAEKLNHALRANKSATVTVQIAPAVGAAPAPAAEKADAEGSTKAAKPRAEKKAASAKAKTKDKSKPKPKAKKV
jgi:large subunit ribosomal protein L4